MPSGTGSLPDQSERVSGQHHPEQLACRFSDTSPEAPSGENLEYDALYLEMEQAAAGKPEQQMGDSTIPAENPDWKVVVQKALELAVRTKDLRVGMLLTQALMANEGLFGFEQGLRLLRGYVQQHWETVHPQLDADDDDPDRRQAGNAREVFF